MTRRGENWSAQETNLSWHHLHLGLNLDLHSNLVHTDQSRNAILFEVLNWLIEFACLNIHVLEKFTGQHLCEWMREHTLLSYHLTVSMNELMIFLLLWTVEMFLHCCNLSWMVIRGLVYASHSGYRVLVSKHLHLDTCQPCGLLICQNHSQTSRLCYR